MLSIRRDFRSFVDSPRWGSVAGILGSQLSASVCRRWIALQSIGRFRNGSGMHEIGGHINYEGGLE